MAQISLVKTLVLSYLELQRQIDNHTPDEPAYLVRGWRDEQEAILASLEAKEPKVLSPDENPWKHSSPDAVKQFEQLLESQKEDVE